MSAKRLLDVVVSAAALLLLAPLFLLIALAIKLDSRGEVFFRQERVGLHGRLFRIHKFRTMVSEARLGSQLTVGEDPRITLVGRYLRRYKLDELPQLIDVVLGTMSLVGPRPEVPKYVAQYPAALRNIVLSVRPGITDEASIQFAEEAMLLAGAEDPERMYLDEVLPRKLAAYVDYVHTHTVIGDMRIILRTIARISKISRSSEPTSSRQA